MSRPTLTPSTASRSEMRIPGIFTLRVYAYLRRGVVAIERIADAAESLAYAES